MFAYILQFITLKRTNVLKREAHSKFMRHLLCKNELGSPCYLVDICVECMNLHLECGRDLLLGYLL